MQKVFRRTVLAERQAARRLEKRKEKNAKIWLKNNNEQTGQMKAQDSALKKQARVWRKEDYELGPLAPKRDVGGLKDTYGTIPSDLARGPLLYKPDLEDKLAAWGGKLLNLKRRDRVVLLEGHDKGKIGRVIDIDKQRAEVTVKGLNMADIAIPSYMIPPNTPGSMPTLSKELPIPINSVRLVHTIKTIGANGKEKSTDVIVKKLVHQNIWRKKYGDTTWERVIPDLNIIVPWPGGQLRGNSGKEPNPAYAKKDRAADTLRIDVEHKTFVPTLFSPPMPPSIIDELRNKFSVFRTRHEPEYIARKEEEEYQKDVKKKLIKLMRLPLHERGLQKAKQKGKLTSQMLEKIGRAIANKKRLTLKPEVTIKKKDLKKLTV